MKLTRENIEDQLKKACCGLLEVEDDICYQSIYLNEWFKHSKLCDLTHQLIKEHYDNPPLKFEELEEDMWVWDDYNKEYKQIAKTNLDKMGIWYYGVYCEYEVDKFEENRLYKKEVKE